MIRAVARAVVLLLTLSHTAFAEPPSRLLEHAAGGLERRLDRGFEISPRYTIPENATLIGATTQTALIGRVPVKGRVRDPYPFKVITGRLNFAANGYTLPPVIKGSVWRGTARGDWSGGCVSGTLESITFIFADGTILTQRSKENEPLATLSDAWGNPCIPGTPRSDATQWLGWRALAAATQGAAAAFTEGQTTTSELPSGGSRRSVNDPAAFAMGGALSSAADDAAGWIRDRHDQSSDVVYLPPGADVAIHLHQPIHIDYDPNGRRLIHDPSPHHRATYLD